MSSTYMESALKGFNAKLITESIFRDSKAYETYPFGYESSFSRLLSAMDYKNSSETFLQLRSMPDLLVIDSDKKEVFLVECKYRNVPKLKSLMLKKSDIEKYKRYWRGCILVVIVPRGEFLYAQNVDELNISTKKVYDGDIYFDTEKEFKPFVDIFTRVNRNIINKCQKPPIIDGWHEAEA